MPAGHDAVPVSAPPSGDDRRTPGLEARGGRGASALVLGGLATVLVAVAVGLAALSAPSLVGLVLVAVGLVFALAGLVLGTTDALRGDRRHTRAAVSGAGLSVAGLAGGLVWVAVFVLTAFAGPNPPLGLTSSGVSTPACAPTVCSETR